MQQAETFLSQKVNCFPLSFTIYWKGEIHCFHDCSARVAHGPGAFITTELLEGLLPALCEWQN